MYLQHTEACNIASKSLRLCIISCFSIKPKIALYLNIAIKKLAIETGEKKSKVLVKGLYIHHRWFCLDVLKCIDMQQKCMGITLLVISKGVEEGKVRKIPRALA